MSDCHLIIFTFIITAFWDILLRIIVEHQNNLPKFFQLKFLKYLIPYFKQHTLLAAALIAGFVGAFTQFIILSLLKFPINSRDILYILQFLLATFTISGLFGIPIRISGLFPHLVDTYYKGLGPINGFIHDGVSGLIVQITLLLLSFLMKKK